VGERESDADKLESWFFLLIHDLIEEEKIANNQKEDPSSQYTVPFVFRRPFDDNISKCLGVDK